MSHGLGETLQSPLTFALGSWNFHLCLQQRPSIFKLAIARFFLCPDCYPGLEDLGRWPYQEGLPEWLPLCFLHVLFPKPPPIMGWETLGVRVSDAVSELAFSSSLLLIRMLVVVLKSRPKDLALLSVCFYPVLVISFYVFSLSLSLVQCFTVFCLSNVISMLLLIFHFNLS